MHAHPNVGEDMRTDIAFNMYSTGVHGKVPAIHVQTHEGVLKMFIQGTRTCPTYKHSQLGALSEHQAHAQTYARTYACIPKCNACSLSMHN